MNPLFTIFNQDFVDKKPNLESAAKLKQALPTCLNLYIKKSWENKEIEFKYIKTKENKIKELQSKVNTIQNKIISIYKEIQSAAKNHHFHLALEWIYYYIATVLLEEGLSPTSKIGKSTTYIEGYIIGACMIAQVITSNKKRKQRHEELLVKKNLDSLPKNQDDCYLTPNNFSKTSIPNNRLFHISEASDPLHQNPSPFLDSFFSKPKPEIATLEEWEEILLELAYKNIKEIDFISIQSKEFIEKKLLLLDEKSKKIKIILEELQKKTAEQIQIHSCFLEKENHIYVKTNHDDSCFQKRSPEIVKKIAQDLTNQKNETEIKNRFSTLLRSLGEERNRIAQEDQSEKADEFGKMRSFDLKTSLTGRYREHGHKIFHLIKECYENWMDIKESKKQELSSTLHGKKIRISEFSFLQLDSFCFEKKEENQNITTITKIYYEKNNFFLNIYLQREDGLASILSKFRIEPIFLFSLGDPFPSFNLSKITLYHTPHSLAPNLIIKLKEIIVKCIKSDQKSLKSNLAQFIYIFAHGCIYSRGSAAINEWLSNAILLTHGFQGKYGKSKKIGNSFYQEVIDLDALTSSFNEFEKTFINKLKLYPIDLNLPNHLPVSFDANLKEALTIKFLAWNSIPKEKIDPLQKKELLGQKIDLLFFGVRKGIVEIVEGLLEDPSIEKNPFDSKGHSLLTAAAESNQLAIFEMIWEKKKDELDPNQETGEERTPLIYACMNNNVEIAKILLTYPNINLNSKGADGFSAFQIACFFNHVEMVEFLLSFRNKTMPIPTNHLDCTEENQLNQIIRNCSKLEINDLLMNCNGFTLSTLALAAQKGFAKIVDLLLSEPDIDVNQEDPLAEAYENNEYEIGEKLLKHPKIQISERAKKYIAVPLQTP